MVQAVSCPWQKAAICGHRNRVASLGAHHRRVMGRFWKLAVTAVIQKAIAPTAVADEDERSQEDQGADSARLPLQ